MVNKVSAVIFCFLIINSFSVLKASDTKEVTGSNWEIVSQENGIQVMERWITNEKNLKVKERSGKMILNCSMQDVINLISDAERTHLWMSNVEEVKVLKRVNGEEWFVHTVLDAPWPFNKQDMVSKYQIVNDADNLTTRVFIDKEDKLLSPQKDIDRLDTFNAVWVIEQVKENKVKVTFTTLSTQPPKYSSWAQDPVVRKVFSTNLKNFKAIVNKA